ncbi:uncharacterized protein LOC111058843 [Nilaparvata lugens]|uniref:uncharacterized protein LOC111058843 n=1 Tax=Nilaparvata lugens TaxID=108931 RepID=UPI00193EAFD0|nr:uncharacterized protein LOC111058843 [Nilaparvata lugens]
MEGGLGLQRPEPPPRSRSPIAPRVKKPVPLPRRSVMDANKPPTTTTQSVNGFMEGAGSSSSINSSGSEDKKNNESRGRSGSVIEETLTKGYNTLTKSLKKEMKSASGCVQEKGKAVIEGTKNVSVRLEKSFKGMLYKRQCASVVFPSPANLEAKPYERCQSLPGEEIFSSISFDSPMSVDGGSVKNESLTSDDLEESAPPPFPPPPLPDESLYDEVSIRSGHSGGGHSYENYTLPSIMETQSHTNSYYEELPIMKKLSMFQDSDSEGSFNDTLKSSRGKDVKRSESWCFYDSVDNPARPRSETYENVMLKDRLNFSSASNIYSELPLGGVVVIGGTKQDSNKSSDKSSTSSEEYSVSASQPDSLASSLSVANELYDNWSPSPLKRQSNLDEDARIRARNRRLYPSKSVILEFDPLYENIPYSALKESEENDSVIDGEQSEPSVEDCEMYSEGSIPIPVPPERFDSITTLSPTNSSPKNIPNDVEYYLYHRKKEDSGGDVVKVSTENSPKNSPVGSPKTATPIPVVEEGKDEEADCRSLSESPEREGSPGKRKASNLVRWTSMKRAIKAVADGSNWSPGVMRRISKSNQKLDQEPLKQDLERPVPDPSSSRIHGGFVFRSSSGGEKQKDFVPKWCQLSEGKLTFTVEKNGACTKDFIQLDTICSIQVMRDVKHSGDGEDVHCMELTVTPRAKTHLIGSPGTTERRIWMQKLLESLTSIFPARLTADYTRAGWCFLKEGIGGEWMVSWILLNKRTLYYSQSNGRLKNVDLRKARSVGLQDGAACPRVTEEGPHILVDSTDQSVYLQMDVPKETKSWRQTIKTAAVDNGPNLSDQQLSKNNIPVIVEKCINFVYAHGLMSEGIYRRCGANSNVTKLLSAFQTDAWAVQLSRQDYTEYDVANVLKRFFRELPEPVFTAHLHRHLCNTAVLKCTEEEKLSIYRTQLEQLPTVNYLTIRLLLSHLYALDQQRERNLMPIKNLAAIWAPTLMHVESVNSTGEVNWSRQESEVIGELVQLYPQLFMVDEEEIARERRMAEVLERYHQSSSQQQPQVMAPAGDLRIWIHIGSKDSTNCVQVTVNPLRLSGDICAALSDKTPHPPHRLCLVETVLDGALTRPLHHSERVLESVLRWSYWDDADCKNNCLVLAENTLFEEVMPLAKQAVPKSGELKFADLKSKSFKSYVFEFSQAKLSYYKDKSGSCKLGEWRIEDISWYLGHEPKRNPQMRWSITFVSKNNKPKRCKETPFFGCTIAGPSREEQMRWIAAMLLGEYPHSDLLPPPKHVNLME